MTDDRFTKPPAGAGSSPGAAAESGSKAANRTESFDILVDNDAMEQLLRKYLERRTAQAVELQNSLRDENYLFIESIGHKLCGSGGAYGLPRLTDLGARIEEAAVLRNAAVLRPLIREYDAYVHNVRILRKN